MKVYLAVENGMCLNYINLHSPNRMRLVDTEFSVNSLRFDTILYNEDDINTIKAIHPKAEIIKFNSHTHFKLFRNAMVLS
jgi:hypothetical protein